MSVKKLDALIVGGGFYGCCIALDLSSKGKDVAIVESENSLLSKASYANQARIHGGYHYPRSFLTAASSRKNFELFIEAFKSSVYSDFTKLYAIARNSEVTSGQFLQMCIRIGAPIKNASSEHQDLFSKQNVESVFEVQEFAFDAKELAKQLEIQLIKSGVEVLKNTSIRTIVDENPSEIRLFTMGPDEQEFRAKEVFLVTYAETNSILADSGLPLIPLQHELAEIALIAPPEQLRNLSVTVMDGPFWSMMPFPSRRGLSSLTHVRYTPHKRWTMDDKLERRQPVDHVSSFPLMLRDAGRFMPSMDDVKYTESLWEVKTILPRSEKNDSRPILFKKDHGMSGLHVIVGGKIDNIFDVLKQLE